MNWIDTETKAILQRENLSWRVRAFMRIPVFGIMVAVAVLVCSGCKDARRGQSSANEFPVSDGSIVLLKRTNEVAAFILTNQQPERTDFYWYYRSDGKGTFPAGEPAVSSGFVTNASMVAFATFKVDWSINTEGKGWVYFGSSPLEIGKSPDFIMCVTTEANLAAIDADARSWKYRARPRVNVRALVESQIKK